MLERWHTKIVPVSTCNAVDERVKKQTKQKINGMLCSFLLDGDSKCYFLLKKKDAQTTLNKVI